MDTHVIHLDSKVKRNKLLTNEAIYAVREASIKRLHVV